jgi:hypothetical protein
MIAVIHAAAFYMIAKTSMDVFLERKQTCLPILPGQTGTGKHSTSVFPGIHSMTIQTSRHSITIPRLVITLILVQYIEIKAVLWIRIFFLKIRLRLFYSFGYRTGSCMIFKNCWTQFRIRSLIATIFVGNLNQCFGSGSACNWSPGS